MAAPGSGIQQVKIVKAIFATPTAKAKLSKERNYEFIINTEENFETNLDDIFVPQLVPYLQAVTIQANQIFPPYQLYIGNRTIFFYIYVELGEDWAIPAEVREYADEYLGMAKYRFTNQIQMKGIIMVPKTLDPYPTYEGSYEQDYTVKYQP